MSDFKPTERTIITETRSFIVDKHTRAPLSRANQSVYLGQSELTVTDINVSANVHHVINVTKHLTVVCPEPVVLSFNSTGPIAPPVLPGNVYHDATIVASDFIIGNDLVITVVDDTPINTVNVVILNTYTGETESLTLVRHGDAFVGTIPTTLNGTWASFDGILHPEHNNAINIMYQDVRSASGNSKQIKTTIKAVSPYSDAEIRIPSMIRNGRPIGIVLEDNDLVETVGSVEVDYVTTSGDMGTVTLLRAVRPYGVVFAATLVTSTLTLVEGDTITFSYNDPMDANGFPKIISAQTTVVPPTNMTGSVIIPNLDSYGTHFIRLSDLDISGSSVQLIVLNERTNLFVPIVCDETVFGSGEFVGELVLTSTQSPNKLQVLPDDVVRVTYVDLNTQSGVSALIEERKAFTLAAIVIVPVDVPVIFVPGTVDMQVDGLFTLFGSFVGTVTVKGLSGTPVRCNIIVA